MTSKEYLENLASFYSNLSGYGLCKLLPIENTDIKILYKGKAVSFMSYNLGFQLGKASWISQKRARMNLKIINSFLDFSNNDLLLTVSIGKNYCKLYLYDRFGNIVKYTKMKYLTINFFKYKLK